MSEGKYILIPTADIQLDRTNPRIQRLIAMYKEPTEDQIGLALGAAGDEKEGSNGGTSFASLKASIKTNKGLIHPIIVNRTSDSLCVIEGNTRLFIYKRLEQEGAEGNWSIIPCFVHDNLEKVEIDRIRLQAHLVGPRAWDPYSKAKYLHFLHHEQDMPMNALVDYCGGRRQEVERYIQAYSDMEEYYRAIAGDEDFDPTRFSAFVEFQRRNVVQAVMAHGNDKIDFSKWVADQKFNRLEHVRQLSRILGDREAAQVFLNRGSRASISLLDSRADAAELGDASLEELASALAQKIKGIGFDEVKEMRENANDSRRVALLDVFSEVKTLVEEVDGEG